MKIESSRQVLIQQTDERTFAFLELLTEPKTIMHCTDSEVLLDLKVYKRFGNYPSSSQKFEVWILLKT